MNPDDIPTDSNPIPLRWGLNDVLWGDDDSVTVLLSGPAGEPYWLELDPERAAVLRQDLAGPDGEAPAADRADVIAEALARVEDPEQRALTSIGLGLGWEAARDVLRRMADEAEKDTQPGDFFQPGRTYRKALAVSTWLYRCEHVTTDPNNGERISLGWHRRLQDDNPAWFPKLPLRQDEWDSGKWAEATDGGDAR